MVFCPGGWKLGSRETFFLACRKLPPSHCALHGLCSVCAGEEKEREIASYKATNPIRLLPYPYNFI